jgi:hypothetical protein
MALVNFELFKQHLKADDYADEDEYLRHLCDTAEAAVIAATHRDVRELLKMNHGELPKELQHAVLLLGAHWHNQREAAASVQMHAVPYAVDALVRRFKKLV